MDIGDDLMELIVRVSSLEDMEKLANTLAKCIKPGYVIGLAGDLGAGKTTFTKFLAKSLGITDNVNSPTFTILKIYEGKLPLYHVDVYRLENIGYDFELDEFLFDDGVTVIEWYPYIIGMLPDNLLTLDIRVVADGAREILIRGNGEYEEAVEAIGNRYGNQVRIPELDH